VFGRRIQKVFTQNSTTTTTNYVYNGADTVEETDQNGNLLAKYARTTNIDEPLAESRSGTTSFYEQDGIGSVTSLTSAGGALASTYTFDSFGKTTNSTGTLTNPFRYTGREFDTETSLYYYRTRYYDAIAGRFISEDRLQFLAGMDFYSYVLNEPTNYADPSGLQLYPPVPVAVLPPSSGSSSLPRLGPPTPCNNTCAEYPAGSLLAFVCKHAGNNPWSNCVRECLKEGYEQCSSFGCIVRDHVKCWLICPGGGGIPGVSGPGGMT
jgi:RHS repeat-associated protein